MCSTDQKPNLLRAERHGYATRLDWDTFTGDQDTKITTDLTICLYS